jgi:hypothetical protein
MAIRFIPECAKGEKRLYEGEAFFRPMTIDEKYDMAAVIKEVSEKDGSIKALMKGLDLVEPLMESCHFKDIESGDEFKDLKSLRADCRNDELCGELAVFVMHGYRVPKNSNA